MGADISPDHIREYLENNPDFFSENRDLLEHLNPPQRQFGDGVVDLQSVMNDRLRKDNDRLKRTQRALISASRSNKASLEQVHAAILCLFDVQSLDELVKLVLFDFPRILDLDATALLVEAREIPADLLAGIMSSGIRPCPPGSVTRWLGIGVESGILLRPNARQTLAIYGDRGGSIKSDALLRLSVSPKHPAVLLAVGTNTDGHFDPTQGTELLGFLADCLSRTLRRWLPATI